MSLKSLAIVLVAFVVAMMSDSADAGVRGNQYFAIDTIFSNRPVGVVSFCPQGSVSSSLSTFQPTSYTEIDLVVVSFLQVQGGSINTGTGFSFLFGSTFFFIDTEGVYNLTATFGVRIGPAACP